ncbi:mannitol-1-phosphate dehydrogenase MPDH1 [Auriscalpium vulgare]|uniref:Mannitol-1-phosphate dehydrogenase MPDH1 n=1 Tax=Auriscalpium vulgare TaxID=40419 RepID=A0ACB8RSN0_9AGAM|nr:mannitol-1-phosphate dehydrogenase MPDH1 [Auriscalpium vulgare]
MSNLSTIPTTQRAAVIIAFGVPVQVYTEHPVPAPGALKPGQCLVRMDVSGVCHSDLHIQKGEWGSRTPPLIGGHEGIGSIVALAQGTVPTPGFDLGSRVGVKWSAEACGRCELCRRGYESLCNARLLSGHTTDGTFSEYVVASVNHVVPIPDGVSSEAAVAVMCAGTTVYRGLKESNTKVGDWIVIPGAGGGLGHLAIQYAVAKGLRVLAIDTGDEKRAACLALGAEKWLDFKESTSIVKDVVAACDGIGPHAALVTSPIGRAYDEAIMYLRPTGTLVGIGMPSTSFNLQTPFAVIVAKCLHIVGSVLGSLQDAVEALDLVARQKVAAQCQLRKLEDINEIFEEMESGRLVGRAVIKF